MTGYVRKDTTNNIADGNVINAADLDAEFDGVQDAFNASTGHNHDGTTGEGAPITALGPTQDVTISASLLAPKTTNTVDIGSSSLKFKDLFLAGNGSIGGTLAVTGVATLTANPVLSGGTANGVAYLNGSKVVTSGSALTFDGTSLGVGIASPTFVDGKGIHINNAIGSARLHLTSQTSGSASTDGSEFTVAGSDLYIINNEAAATIFYNAGSEQMRLTSTGLGIGTSSPVEKVQSSKGVAATGANQSVGSLNGFVADYSSGASRIFASRNGVASSTLELWTTDSGGAANKNATLDSSGNLGLGVTPSAWYTTASTKGFDVSTTGAVWSGAGVDAGVLGNAYFSTAANFKYKTTAAATRYDQASGAHAWYTAASGTAGNAITFTQAMTLDASGNLGIGTTSPSSYGKLAVSGNAALNTNGQLKLYNSANTNWSYIDNPSTDSTAFMRFAVGSGEAARIDSSGNFGIGTTSPASKLHVVGNTRITADIESTGNSVIYSSNGSAAGTINSGFNLVGSDSSIRFFTGNLERARIDSSGNLLVGATSAISSGKYSSSFDGSVSNGIILKTTLASTGTTFIGFVNSSGSIIGTVTQNGASTVAYNTSSDYRLKNTIAPMTGALAKVAQLKPVTYKWNADGSDGEGFIAHELAEVCPHAVTGEKDAVHEDGTPKYQGIDTSFLVATLTAAIQEQQEIIESLKARLDAANL